jgi:hypothetical protein
MRGHDTMKTTHDEDDHTQQRRQPWEPPKLTSVGTISSVLQGGSGKVTVTVGDPGEPRKVPGGDK